MSRLERIGNSVWRFLRSSVVTLRNFWLLSSSKVFQRQFYRQQLKDTGLSGWGYWLPLCHYLFVGHRLGLNPGPEFDGRRYQSVYPDVAQAGINPLVHYFRAGRYEGRLPYRGAPPAFSHPPPFVPRAAYLGHKLWQGFAHIAEPKLSFMARDQENCQAALALAGWAFTDNCVSEAVDWLEIGDPSAPAALSLGRLRGLVKAYSLLGQVHALDVLLSRSGVKRALGDEVGYAEANVQARPEQRLAPVNRLLVERGLVPVTCTSRAGLAGLEPTSSPPAMPNGHWPLISVIVPAFNAGRNLSLALDSLLQQSWLALEVLVVDDASTDDTGAWALSYAERDSRVRYFRNESNLGAYPSRNRGLIEARGEFVTVHDSDDWSHPQKLEVQARPLLGNPDLAATVSHWVRVTPDLSYLGSWMLTNGFVELNPSSWLIRRHWLERLGGWDPVNVGADSEFAQRLEYHLGREALYFLWPDTPLAFARVEAGTLTRTKATHLRTLFHGLRRLYAEASYWWLRQQAGLSVMTDNRPFPVPLGNIRGQSHNFDCVLAGNFAQRGEALDHLMAKLTEAAAGQDRLCLLHWPDYNAWHTNTIADEVFAICQKRGWHFAHAGLTLSAKQVVLLEPELWQKPTTETVCLEGLDAVVSHDGRLCADQAALCDYFRRGGVDPKGALECN